MKHQNEPGKKQKTGSLDYITKHATIMCSLIELVLEDIGVKLPVPPPEPEENEKSTKLRSILPGQADERDLLSAISVELKSFARLAPLPHIFVLISSSLNPAWQ